MIVPNDAELERVDRRLVDEQLAERERPLNFDELAASTLRGTNNGDVPSAPPSVPWAGPRSHRTMARVMANSKSTKGAAKPASAAATRAKSSKANAATIATATESAKRSKGPLLDYALSLPEAYEDHPWGESVAKVNKKVFAFFGVASPAKSLSIKLGDNADLALALPCATPTGYGLGKSGWVSIDLHDKSCPPADVLREWIEESYCNVAPKKLVKSIAERRGPVDQTPAAGSRAAATGTGTGAPRARDVRPARDARRTAGPTHARGGAHGTGSYVFASIRSTRSSSSRCRRPKERPSALVHRSTSISSTNTSAL